MKQYSELTQMLIHFYSHSFTLFVWTFQLRSPMFSWCDILVRQEYGILSVSFFFLSLNSMFVTFRLCICDVYSKTNGPVSHQVHAPIPDNGGEIQLEILQKTTVFIIEDLFKIISLLANDILILIYTSALRWSKKIFCVCVKGCSSPIVVKFADTQKDKEQKRMAQQLQQQLQQLSAASMWGNLTGLNNLGPQYLAVSVCFCVYRASLCVQAKYNQLACCKKQFQLYILLSL